MRLNSWVGNLPGGPAATSTLPLPASLFRHTAGWQSSSIQTRTETTLEPVGLIRLRAARVCSTPCAYTSLGLAAAQGSSQRYAPLWLTMCLLVCETGMPFPGLQLRSLRSSSKPTGCCWTSRREELSTTYSSAASH